MTAFGLMDGSWYQRTYLVKAASVLEGERPACSDGHPHPHA